MTWAYGLPCDGDPIGKFILVTLANFADDFGVTWVSQGRLQRDCACSERKVRDALNAFETAGLILRTMRRRGDGSRQSDGIVLVGFPGRVIPARRDDHHIFELLDDVAWARVSTSNRPRVPVVATGTTCRSNRHHVPGPPAPGAGHEPSLEPPLEPSSGGHGSAQAREAPPAAVAPAVPPESDLTLRERILIACGADPVSGLTGPSGAMLGTRADMHAVARWRADLGLDDQTILAVIADAMARKRDGPPARLTYFDRPMQREAGARNQPRLEPFDAEFSNRPGAGLAAGGYPGAAGGRGPSGLVGAALRRAAARRAAGEGSL